MMTTLLAVLLGTVGGGLAILVLERRRQAARPPEDTGARAEAERLLEAARRETEAARTEAAAARREAELQARDLLTQARADVEKEAREQRRELSALERRVLQKEETLDRKLQATEGREAQLARQEAAAREEADRLAERRREAETLVEEARRKLEITAGLTREEARRSLIEQMTEDARGEAARIIRQIEGDAREEADRRAKKIISLAIERLSGEFVAERSVSVVALPSDDMKGRIIGREGRNIRAIEAATGVDLIIDDTPEAVVISCHNPVRRELARLALERLITDGRIHPGRIEEVVRKAEQELEESIREAGQRAAIELGVHGIHQELIRLVGMLKYRYSYAQNVLGHSIETGFIAGALAAELGLNVKQARRAGLLHDIGKALTHEVEGSHAIVGGEIARKYGESAKIVNAIAAHHEEIKAETILAPLVDAADALSGARPGARREVLESYAKRLEDLERISNSFAGVERSFAVQAGREIRVIVDPGSVPDDRAALLARDVARKIEQEMTYPGQIKVTVIRETRASEIAH
jgi:ribonuclease Y